MFNMIAAVPEEAATRARAGDLIESRYCYLRAGEAVQETRIIPTRRAVVRLWRAGGQGEHPDAAREVRWFLSDALGAPSRGNSPVARLTGSRKGAFHCGGLPDGSPVRCPGGRRRHVVHLPQSALFDEPPHLGESHHRGAQAGERSPRANRYDCFRGSGQPGRHDTPRPLRSPWHRIRRSRGGMNQAVIERAGLPMPRLARE